MADDITTPIPATEPAPVSSEAATSATAVTEPVTAPVPAAPAAPVYATTLAPAPAPEKKHRHGWQVWVASAAIALLIFAAGAHVGFAIGTRFAARSFRAGVTRAAVQQQSRAAAPGGRFGRGFRR